MDATPSGRPPRLHLQGLGKTFPDGTVAVADLDLSVADGEVLCLLGPSGCGKTTTLKMVNRLVTPTRGRILLDGEDVTDADAVRLRRSMGYVIQQVGLFPHLSVADNIAAVPRLLGWDRSRIRSRVAELLELVGLEPHYARRFPAQLSGGQRQRVGVARALAADPPILLMDEPFSAIDPIARTRLQAEFLRIQSQVRKTVLLVTHDLEEAVRLGTRIALFREGGHLEQHATPAELLANPASPFVEQFIGGDRSLRLLALASLHAEDVPGPRPEDRLAGDDAPAGDPTVVLGQSLREVMAAVLASSSGRAVALDAEGRRLGSLDADDVATALRRLSAAVATTGPTPSGASTARTGPLDGAA